MMTRWIKVTAALSLGPLFSVPQAALAGPLQDLGMELRISEHREQLFLDKR